MKNLLSKDVINLWKANKWNPEELMELYLRLRARYFFTLGNHHGNFDNWNSKYHKWNAVNIGPEKDIVGGWEKVAQKYGMYFGVSIHSAHAWDGGINDAYANTSVEIHPYLATDHQRKMDNQRKFQTAERIRYSYKYI